MSCTSFAMLHKMPQVPQPYAGRTTLTVVSFSPNPSDMPPADYSCANPFKALSWHAWDPADPWSHGLSSGTLWRPSLHSAAPQAVLCRVLAWRLQHTCRGSRGSHCVAGGIGGAIRLSPTGFVAHHLTRRDRFHRHSCTAVCVRGRIRVYLRMHPTCA